MMKNIEKYNRNINFKKRYGSDFGNDSRLVTLKRPKKKFYACRIFTILCFYDLPVNFMTFFEKIPMVKFDETPAREVLAGAETVSSVPICDAAGNYKGSSFHKYWQAAGIR